MSAQVMRDDRGGLCTLTLNRPGKLNALDTPAFELLEAHIAELETARERIGCVVLRGAGRAFCAGADLQAMGRSLVAPTFKPAIIERLGSLPQPVIAAVHGACYTGGLELALACDFILADGSARFADTHGKWGLVGQWGMTQRLPRRVGMATAKRMMLTSCVVAAAEAKEIGLVDVLVAEGGLDEAVAGLAEQILSNSWHTNFETKRLLAETDGMSLAQGLAHEHYRHPGFAPDYRERIMRFHKNQ